MMWVCESRMYVNVVAVFHAMVSHVAFQLLQRMIKYDAESSAGVDIKLSLSKPQCITCRSHKKPRPAGVLERCSGDPSELPKQLQTSHEPSIEPDTHSENQARLASSGGSSVQQVDAMLVFSSPRSLVLPSTAQRLRVRQLQSHDLEMRSLSRMLGSSLHVVPAAEWPLDLELALDRVGSSRVLVLSGHFINVKFVFENEKRDGVLVSGKQFVETLVRQLRAEVPELILLNGCMSCGFGREILDELNQRVELDHDVFVVGCATKLQDNFAAHFCKELCDRVLLQSLSVPQAFQDSCSLFTSARNGSQFQMGDPATYLHTGTQREHAYDPECVGCKPPVHGVYELLTLDPATRRITRNESHASSSTSTTPLNNTVAAAVMPSTSQCTLVPHLA